MSVKRDSIYRLFSYTNAFWKVSKMAHRMIKIWIKWRTGKYFSILFHFLRMVWSWYSAIHFISKFFTSSCSNLSGNQLKEYIVPRSSCMLIIGECMSEESGIRHRLCDTHKYFRNIIKQISFLIQWNNASE